MHVPTRACDKLSNELQQLCLRDFQITGVGLVETFLGTVMEIEQQGKVIRMHLDTYAPEVLAEYREYIKKAHRHDRPKRLPTRMNPGIVLNNEDCPTVPDQPYCRSFIAKLQFAASWVRLDTSLTVSSLALS